MRILALWLALLAAPTVACADDILFKVGVTTRDFVPAEPYDWRGAGTHVLRTTIWYPATADAREEAQWIGPPVLPFFSAGSAARDAALAPGARRPLVLLSHGDGDTASALGWLGTALAAHGYIVAGVNHPGNNALEDYTVDGFALRWLRAVDLRAVIDAPLRDPTFGPGIDPARIGAAGHSLGGYTVIAIAGGISDPARLQAFCRSPAADISCRPPPPSSEMRQKTLARLESDPDFRQRYGKAAISYRDQRVRAVLALAPGPGPIFTPDSLRKIQIPVAIVVGSADQVVPVASSAGPLAQAIPQATLKVFEGAGHFVFRGNCTLLGRWIFPTPCGDPEGVDRTVVHAETSGLALDFFGANLP
ncbi:Predicted dienelactone hydrolase [Enhydrobacter aerosaccus]|uniref:Predicted dienelactone hydrolase n=1 Tax=Enhydrobacter aerosaccus TaxID=225324 RepID=A0A1T4TDI5_9HYPH|nr:alpha/beta hydrolase [Enhydrobacter aerosaccus]SKA38238.1 Predicted dienelactone hydrolase [Enhydrobacter aerosaccus]